MYVCVAARIMRLVVPFEIEEEKDEEEDEVEWGGS